MVLHHVANTIARGISRRSLSKAFQRRYTKQVFTANVISPGFPENIVGTTGLNIVFYEKHAICINPHDNDLLVIIVQRVNWDIRRFLIDPGSSVDALY